MSNEPMSKERLARIKTIFEISDTPVGDMIQELLGEIERLQSELGPEIDKSYWQGKEIERLQAERDQYKAALEEAIDFLEEEEYTDYASELRKALEAK